MANQRVKKGIQRIVGGPAQTLALLSVQVVLLFFTNILLARRLGPEGFGIYALAFSTLTILTVVSTFGGRGTIIRYVASYLKHSDYSHARGLINFFLVVGIGISLLFSVFGILCLRDLGLGGTAEFDRTFSVMFLCIPASTFVLLRQFVARGFNLLFLALAPEGILLPSVFLLFLAVPINAGELSPSVAFGLYGSALLITAVVGFFSTKAKIEGRIGASPPSYAIQEWAKSGGQVSISSMLQVVSKRVDIYVLAAFLPMDQVGLYSVAMKIALSVNIVQMGIRVWAAPTVAEFFAAGQREFLQEFVKNAVRISSTLALVPIMVLLVFSGQLLSLFGGGFFEAATVLRILLIAEWINISFGLAGNLLLMTGHEAEYTKTVSASAIFGISAYFVLIPGMGILGAAIAFLLAVLFQNVLSAIYVFKRTKIICLLH